MTLYCWCIILMYEHANFDEDVWWTRVRHVLLNDNTRRKRPTIEGWKRNLEEKNESSRDARHRCETLKFILYVFRVEYSKKHKITLMLNHIICSLCENTLKKERERERKFYFRLSSSKYYEVWKFFKVIFALNSVEKLWNVIFIRFIILDRRPFFPGVIISCLQFNRCIIDQTVESSSS